MLFQALMGGSQTLYTQFELLNAFALFADPDEHSGCISYKSLKDALVRMPLHLIAPTPQWWR